MKHILTCCMITVFDPWVNPKRHLIEPAESRFIHVNEVIIRELEIWTNHNTHTNSFINFPVDFRVLDVACGQTIPAGEGIAFAGGCYLWKTEGKTLWQEHVFWGITSFARELRPERHHEIAYIVEKSADDSRNELWFFNGSKSIFALFIIGSWSENTASLNFMMWVFNFALYGKRIFFF